MNIRKDTLKKWIKEEKETSEVYMDIYRKHSRDPRYKFFKQASKDEAKHARNFERLLNQLESGK